MVLGRRKKVKSEITISSHKVSFNQKAYFGISIAGATLAQSLIDFSLLTYYTDFILFPEVLFGIVYLLYGFWNAINDPLFGYYSDKKRPIEGKGKRLHWMWKSLPFLIGGFFLLYLVNPTWDQILIFFILLTGLFLFDTGLTIFMINRNSLLVSITDDDNERSSIVIVSMIFQTLLGVLSYLLPLYFLTKDTPIIAILLMFSGLGLTSTFFLIYGIKGLKEPLGIYKEKDFLNLKHIIKETFKSRAFIIFICYTFLMSGVAQTYLTFLFYYIDDVIQVSGLLATLAGAISLPAAFIAYLVVRLTSKRIGVYQTLIIFLSLTLLGCLSLLIIKNYWLMVMSYIFIIVGTNAHWILIMPLIGNIADEYELRTNSRNEGIFFGINAICVALSKSILIFIFTLFLDYFGYDGSKPIQSHNAILGIRLGAALVPLIFVAISIILMYFYPLKGEKLKKLKKEIKILYDDKFSNSID